MSLFCSLTFIGFLTVIFQTFLTKIIQIYFNRYFQIFFDRYFQIFFDRYFSNIKFYTESMHFRQSQVTPSKPVLEFKVFISNYFLINAFRWRSNDFEKWQKSINEMNETTSYGMTTSFLKIKSNKKNKISHRII